MNRLCIQLVSWLIVANLVSLPSALYGYAFLSEFVSSDLSSIRTSVVSDSDLIKHPRWDTGSAINLRFCTGGTGITNTTIYADNPAQENTELAADINSAIDSWNSALTNTDLSINDVTVSGACGPAEGTYFGGTSGGSAGNNDIFFNNVFESAGAGQIPNGVVAFTIINLQITDGEIEIVDADIVFNSEERFATETWINAQGVNPNCPVGGDSGCFSFLGVLTHEMGHLLGIAHSFVTDDNATDGLWSGATMFPAVSGLDQTIDISQLVRDDILAAKNLYADSGTFTGSTYGGRITGTVTRSNARGQRGAHITAFSIESNRTLAATLSSMSGTKGDPDGTYSIRGLPLNEEFIVFVEPADRSDPLNDNFVHSNFAYNAVNTPLAVALDDEGEGWRSFFIEAYPDTTITDLRVARDVSASPGITGATSFELSAGSPTQSGINFFISPTIPAPNDSYNLDLQITNRTDPGSGTLTITNSAPLQFEATLASQFEDLSGLSIEVSAIRDSDSEVFDWSSSLPSTSGWRTNSALVTLAPPSGTSNDLYEVSISLSASVDGETVELSSATRVALVSNWNQGSASVVFGDGTRGSSGGGGGGCVLSSSSTAPWTWVLMVIISMMLLRIGNLRSFATRRIKLFGMNLL